VIRTFANLGSGFDTVSGGDIQRVMAGGWRSSQCVFAGVGRPDAEIEFGLKKSIYSFNVESEPELQRINRNCRASEKVCAHCRSSESQHRRQNACEKSRRGPTRTSLASRSRILKVSMRGPRRLKNLRLRGLQMHIGSAAHGVCGVKALQAGRREGDSACPAAFGTASARILQHRGRLGHRFTIRPGQRGFKGGGGRGTAGRF